MKLNNLKLLCKVIQFNSSIDPIFLTQCIFLLKANDTNYFFIVFLENDN